MKKLQVFDPALCCSSGVCGSDVDQKLVDFSADADWAKQQGAVIERFNLAQQPMAFAEHSAIRALLQRSGDSALPATLLDGELALAGRYPTRAELARWTNLQQSDTCCTESDRPATTTTGGACCGGGKCCG
ncbi:MAG: arsenical resistance operon transcriptional repressor ArsD [Comamonadaceae bacterium CG1_02_60_18]|nr:MAG: arsenical resistance operon transcriptional repressor ArsD [Comamonadaceae bacterium CG1_02_60_18]PIQ52095.1 MAG: arsenical resistance operon transcriptional repressor ArsD [Comamonadaceae bacterium CG12_big_fil_rev_8_21_14_0_65_59_15]